MFKSSSDAKGVKRKLDAAATAGASNVSADGASRSASEGSPLREKPTSQTPLSGTSARSAPSVSAVASSVLSAGTRRVRRGSIVYETSRVESKHFNAKELQHLAKQFTSWTNKQNVMDREAFRKSLGLLGMVQDALLCHQLFRVFNRSGTGKISFEEYVCGLGVLMKGTLDEKLDFSFNMTDIDGSGEISFEELVLTVDSMTRIYAGIMGGQATVIDKDKIKTVFGYLDKDRDGKITMDEYKNGMKRHPEFLNTLRGTELFRPISGSSSSFRLASARVDKLEHVLGEVLQELFRAEDTLKLMRDRRLLQGQNHGNGTGVYDVSSPSNRQNDEDADTDQEESAGNEDDMIIRDLAQAIATAKVLCESQLPSSVRQRRSDLTSTSNSANIASAIKSTPTTPTSGSKVGIEEEETKSDSPSNDLQTSTLPTPPPVRQPTPDNDEASETTMTANNAETVKADSTSALSQSLLDEFAASTINDSTQALQPAEGDGSGLPPTAPVANKRKGLTVFFGHKNWDLVVNVMKGIQMAVSRSAMEQERPVSPYDFAVKEKYTLVSAADTKGDHRTRFVDYAPFVFAKLREHFCIDHEEYMNSIGPGSMLSNLMLGSLSSLAEMGSEGKSGSFFYLSSDGRFLVKTVRKDEHKLLRNILPSYFRHMTKAGSPDVADSLLTRIVGCHVVRSSKRSKTRTGAHKVYFVVMTNALETDLEVHRKYDLKGSWVGRRTAPTLRDEPGKTLKDMDLTESKDRVFVDARMKDMLMASLRRDATFLESHHIIDYSVLLGVHDHSVGAGSSQLSLSGVSVPGRLSKETSNSSLVSRQGKAISTLNSSNSLALDPVNVPFFAQFHGGFRSLDGRQTYFMGIIDFLTQYGERKRLERFVKTIAHFNSSGLSVMPARAYAKRFLTFLDKRVIVADVDRVAYMQSVESSALPDHRHPMVAEQ